MNRYTDFDNQTLSELTEDEIHDLVIRELLEAGVPISMEKPPIITAPSAPTSDIVYRLDMEYGVYLSADDASKAIAWLNAQNFYTFEKKTIGGWDGPAFVVENPDTSAPFKLVTQAVYTEAIANDLHKAKKEYDKVYGDLKGKHEAYKTWQNTVDQIESDVLGAVRAAKEEVDRKAYYKQVFGNYVELANGDEHVAKAFFIKAYGEDFFTDYIKE